MVFQVYFNDNYICTLTELKAACELVRAEKKRGLYHILLGDQVIHLQTKEYSHDLQDYNQPERATTYEERGCI